LCTNYDVYCVREPTVFEAMALLHARIRRLVFCQARSAVSSAVVGDDNTNDRGITQHMIHALQHTNHRYRAFQLVVNDESPKHDDDVSKRPEAEQDGPAADGG
jgi:tRNA(Arg) A34 adenosine deaminase TadA